jgi:uncharacterized protein (DUF1778 family)
MSEVKPSKRRSIKSEKKTKSEARLDVRMEKEHKDLIEEAANAIGVTVTDFTTSTLVRSAREVLAEQQVLELSNRDRDKFLAALGAPPQPSRALRRAAERYKRQF